MLDIKFIRENLELIKTTAKNKNIKLDLDRLVALDDQRREFNLKIEDLRNRKNETSKNIPKMSPAEKQEALAQMKEVDAEQNTLENQLKPIFAEYQTLLLQAPMIVDERTPVGPDDSANVEMRKWGEPRQFNFSIKSHEELGASLGLVDFERAAKIAGARSYVLLGDGARYEGALMKYAEDFMTRRGYKLMSVPVIVNKFALEGTGYFPGGEEEIYTLERDEKYLVGTSEVSIGAFYANEILDEQELPLRLVGFSICFRREAGSYGKDTKGLYRVHQFLKIEQFIIGKNSAEESRVLHDELLKNSEDLLQSLQLPYRVLNVCTGDMGKGKYYMNDIETWMPSRNNYGETHSCSTFHDFQARRLNLRYKNKDGKIQFCHTLNNTVIATPRVMIPLWEQYQNEDGTINIPEVLRPYFDGQERIVGKG